MREDRPAVPAPSHQAKSTDVSRVLPGHRAQAARSGKGAQLAAAFVVLLGLALAIIAATGSLAPGDLEVARLIQKAPGGGGAEEVADLLAFRAVEFWIWVGGALLLARKQGRWALLTAAIVALALLVNPLLKEVIARPRPDETQLVLRESPGGYGFPSGHMASAMLLYGFLVYGAFQAGISGARKAALALFAVVILVIGFDRVYNGAHWPSDVIGGAVVGFVLLAIAVNCSVFCRKAWLTWNRSHGRR